MGSPISIVLTNGEWAAQFGELPDGVLAFDLDKPLRQVASAGLLHLTQGSVETTIDARTPVTFFPFRSPYEPGDHRAAAGAIFGLASLIATLQNLGVVLRNDPDSWLRAYDKSALFALAYIVEIPETTLYLGASKIAAPVSGRHLVKSGLGIRKLHRGGYLEAAMLPPGETVDVPRGQRYAVQRYLPVEREIRSYCIRPTAGAPDCLSFDMPVGTAETPDWRDALDDAQFHVSSSSDPIVDSITRRIRERLNLDYVCVDIVVSSARHYLVDVNPHGSWAWLPEHPRRQVSDMVTTYLRT